jgi:FtsZ-interacting cell division protein YlmF
MITPAASPIQHHPGPAYPRLHGPEVLLMAPTTMAEAAGQRLVDYACGGMAAIDGQSHQLGLGVFLFTSGLTRVEAA